MRRTLTSTLGWVPSRQYSFVSKYQAKNFLKRLFSALSNCQFHTLRGLLAPDFKQYIFNSIGTRERSVASLRRQCVGPIVPQFKFRIIARQDSRSFAVQVRVFRRSKVLFTLNNNCTLRRRRRCSKKLKTCFELASSVNHLRRSDLLPFGSLDDDDDV